MTPPRDLADAQRRIDELTAENARLRNVIDQVVKLAYDPDLAEGYGPTAIVVDATLLQRALESGAK